MIKESILVLSAVFLIGCGGGGGDTVLPITEPIVDTPTDTYTGEDPFVKYQWSFHDTPDLYYVNKYANSSITAAKEYNQGEGATIAIIDTCFDLTHEDTLSTNIIATKNIGDDSEDISCKEGESTHGQMVFGILAAQNNGVGLIGVTPNANYILIKIPTYVSDQDIINAFTFAEENGATTISNSWSTTIESDTERYLFEDLKNKNISIVFACGNEGESLDQDGIEYECEDSAVLGIGASNENNEIAYYSNYGSNMDILAPAGDHGVVTTKVEWDNSYYIDNLDTLQDQKYTYFAGTSASTPLVAGIIGLLQTEQSNLTPDQIREAIINSAEKIGGVSYTNGWNDYYAYGKINAEKAIEYIINNY